MVSVIKYIIGCNFLSLPVALVAYLIAGKGKAYIALLAVGFAFYSLALFGLFHSGEPDTETLVGEIVALIIMVVMIPICERKRRKAKGIEKNQNEELQN